MAKQEQHYGVGRVSPAGQVVLSTEAIVALHSRVEQRVLADQAQLLVMCLSVHRLDRGRG